MGRMFFGPLILIALLNLPGCGKGGANSQSARTQSPPIFGDQDIDYNLQPVISQNPNLGNNQNPNTLNIISKGLTRNPKSGQVSLKADIDGKKDIDLVGSFDAIKNEARLYSPDKNTEAIVVCAKTNDETCEQMVVTVYQKGKPGHQQFSKIPRLVAPVVVDDSEEDEGEGPDEYVLPRSDFEVNVGPSLSEDSYNPDMSQAVGPHTCVRDDSHRCLEFGSILNGVKFPESGPGFTVRSGELGVWTTQAMVDVFTRVAREVDQVFSTRPVLEIGDLAKKGGGYWAPHASHQNGLDIDIAYPTLKAQTGEKWEDMSFGKVVSPNFDIERFWFLSKRLSSVSKVVFNFTDPAIKLEVCKLAKSRNEFTDDRSSPAYKPNSPAFRALATMRFSKKGKPEFNHRNHFHIREQCFPGMSLCHEAAEIPIEQGTGCPLTI